jgi:hypothetical protein
MAGLTLAGEKQYGFPVLVLHPLEGSAIQNRDIQDLLSGRMGIKLCAYFIGHGPYLLVVSTFAE